MKIEGYRKALKGEVKCVECEYSVWPGYPWNRLYCDYQHRDVQVKQDNTCIYAQR